MSWFLVLNEREMLPRFLDRVDSLCLPYTLFSLITGLGMGPWNFWPPGRNFPLSPMGKTWATVGPWRTGCRLPRRDRVIIIDADGEYPPEAIPLLLKGLEQTPVVYASRFLNGGKIAMSRTRSWGNRGLTALFNLFTGSA